MRHPHQTPGRRRHRTTLVIVAVKLAVIALVLALPSGVAAGLGAAHGVVLLAAAAAAGLLLLARYVRKIRTDGREGER